MKIQCYLNFQGNCRQAVEFYSKVFDTSAKIMTYADMPSRPEFPIPDELKHQVLHAEMELEGNEIMFVDVPPDQSFCCGNQIRIILNGEDTKTLTRWFHGLSEGGEIEIPLESTFWSELYGSVIDPFGVCWQINKKRDC